MRKHAIQDLRFCQVLHLTAKHIFSSTGSRLWLCCCRRGTSHSWLRPKDTVQAATEALWLVPHNQVTIHHCARQNLSATTGLKRWNNWPDTNWPALFLGTGHTNIKMRITRADLWQTACFKVCLTNFFIRVHFLTTFDPWLAAAWECTTRDFFSYSSKHAEGPLSTPLKCLGCKIWTAWKTHLNIVGVDNQQQHTRRLRHLHTPGR